MLRSKDFDILLDYLKKSGSTVAMPQVILDEIIGLYKRAIDERVTNYNKSAGNINLILAEPTSHVKLLELDKEVCLSEYIKYVKEKLEIKDSQILPYKDSFLTEIANRAINRQKPSGDDGQGFRDTLIWLTILDYAVKTHEKQVVFISSNYTDFGYKDKTAIHESLENECNTLGIKVNYFKDLKEFILIHSTKIEFITYEWIAKNLNYKTFSDELCDRMSSREASRITLSFQRSTGNDAVGEVDAKEANPYKESNLYIYEMLDNRLIVNVTIHCEVLVGLEYYRRSYDYSYDDYYRERSTEARWLDVEVYLNITIIDAEIQDYEIDDWDFYDDWR